MVNCKQPPPEQEHTTMSKSRNHHNKHHRQPVKDVPIIVKRSLAELRKTAEEEEQARWEELQLAHQLSKWL